MEWGVVLVIVHLLQISSGTPAKGKDRPVNDQPASKKYEYEVEISVSVDDETLSKYTVSWKLPSGGSSEEVTAHRVYYKEYTVEEIIGYKDVPVDTQQVVIVDEYRDLELRWVELLKDGREGLATPYFDTYFEDTYLFNVEISTNETFPDQAMIEWDIPAASDQFIDVIPEFLVEWRASAGSVYMTMVSGDSKATITGLEANTTYYIRVQQVRLGTRLEGQLPWIPYIAHSMVGKGLSAAPQPDLDLSGFLAKIENLSPEAVRVSWSRPTFSISRAAVYYKDNRVRDAPVQVKYVSGGDGGVVIDSVNRNYIYQLVLYTDYGRMQTSWMRAGSSGGFSLVSSGSSGGSSGRVVERVITGGPTGSVEEVIIGDGSSGAGVVVRAPGDFRIAIGSNSARVTWSSPASSAAITGYEILYRSGSAPSSEWHVQSVAADSRNLVIEGLTSGAKYSFKMRAVTASGQGMFTNEILAETSGGSAVSQGFVTRSDPHGVWISWTAGLMDSLTGYQIAYIPAAQYGPSTPDSSWTVVTLPADSSLYFLELADSGVDYRFRMRSVGRSGYGKYSMVVGKDSGSAGDAVVGNIVDAPQSFTVSADGKNARVSWSGPPSFTTFVDYWKKYTKFKGASYQIFYTSDLRQPDSAWQVLSVSADKSEQVVSGLQAATQYHFKMRAVGSVNVGPFTELASIRTPKLVLDPPARFRATVINNAIKLSWESSSAADDLTGYEIAYISSEQYGPTVSESEWSVQRITVGTSDYLLEGLRPETGYVVKMRSVGRSGSGEYTRILRTTTGEAMASHGTSVQVLAVAIMAAQRLTRSKVSAAFDVLLDAVQECHIL